MPGEEEKWWEQQWEKTSHSLRGHIRIGANTWIPLEELLHMVILGPTGMGKSKYLEFLVRQLITHPRRPAVVFLDPAGDSYHELFGFIASQNLQERTILFDPEEEEKVVGYDPMAEADSIAYKAAAQVQATLKALGVKEMDSVLYMPQLKLIFYNLYHALMESGLSLAEAGYLLSFEDEPLRGALLERLRTESVRKFWQAIDQLRFSQREERLSLAHARLHPFLANDSIRMILSQKRHTIDFGRIIDRGEIMLVNLQPRAITSEDQKLLGTLIIRDAIDATFSRLRAERRDLFLVVDEFQDLIPPDVGRIMRAGRKYRLHLILATTSLEDLKESYPSLYHEVWGNATIKVLFGDMPEEELEGLAKEFYLQELNLKQRKLELYRTFFEPEESSRTIEGHFWGRGVSELEAEGSSFYLGEELFPGRTVRQESQAAGSSSSSGGSRAEVPFYEFEEREELASVQFWPLEELLWKAKAKLKGLRKREIVIRARGKGLRFDEVPEMEEIAPSEEELERAKREVFSKQPCYATIEQIEAERLERLESFQPREPPKKRWQKR